MRHIPKSRVRAKVTRDWRDRAAEAAEAVLDAAPEDRDDKIDEYDDLWAELKGQFEDLLNGKCWYSESKNPGCDKDMDHFRPKKGVWGVKDHPGYWWLAFDWENYRFCCQFCNRLRTDPTNEITGGKSTQFPLLNPAARVTNHNLDVHYHEQVLLLDPLVSTDPGLLSFEPDGRAISRATEADSGEEHERATKSAEVYNLNFHTFLKARAKLFGDIEGLVEEGDKFLEKDGRTVRPGQHRAFNLVVGALLEKSDIGSEFSAAAREYIRHFRKRPWIEQKVMTEF